MKTLSNPAVTPVYLKVVFLATVILSISRMTQQISSCTAKASSKPLRQQWSCCAQCSFVISSRALL